MGRTEDELVVVPLARDQSLDAQHQSSFVEEQEATCREHVRAASRLAAKTLTTAPPPKSMPGCLTVSREAQLDATRHGEEREAGPAGGIGHTRLAAVSRPFVWQNMTAHAARARLRSSAAMPSIGYAQQIDAALSGAPVRAKHKRATLLCALYKPCLEVSPRTWPTRGDRRLWGAAALVFESKLGQERERSGEVNSVRATLLPYATKRVSTAKHNLATAKHNAQVAPAASGR